MHTMRWWIKLKQLQEAEEEEEGDAPRFNKSCDKISIPMLCESGFITNIYTSG